jgi:ABC-type transport system involved in cytochrome bd biosynthesis fused ATPase/permease subunit
MLYVKHSKKEVLLTGAIVVVCAPLIFIFISIVLTLTQAIAITTFEAMRETEI